MNPPTSPVISSRVMSIRDGVFLSEYCEMAPDFIENPASSHFLRQFFVSNSTEAVDSPSDSFVPECLSESVTQSLTIELPPSNTLRGDVHVQQDAPPLQISSSSAGISVDNDSRSLSAIGTTAAVADHAEMVHEFVPFNVPILSDNELSNYLQDQPSTSGSRYGSEVEAVIDVNKFAKRRRTTSFLESHALSEHNYSKSVCVFV